MVVIVAREPNKKATEARKLYQAGMKLVDIANKLDVPAGTVRRWKSSYKWDTNKSERSEKKTNARNKKEHIVTDKKKTIVDEVEQMVENSDLTDKQQLFCLYYIRCFNATKAYQKAYGCSYETALTNGSALLGNTRIKNKIQELKKNRLNREMLSEEDIFQKYMDIAFADITDYVSFGTKEIEYTDKAGNDRRAEISYVDLKESTEIDGTLITEISQGKDGVKIKLADRMKALQWIADHMNLATEEQKVRIGILKSQIKQKDDAKEQAQDWKAAIIEIAKRRGEKVNGRTD
ncbi:MAG: terminase small subunit [Lachnospiraceae bacterium]|nr:terminase small subunit [Lachnospiraceae bacterium]MBP3477582.1 terminase small subunit [Lachnospiraceae bacterium]